MGDDELPRPALPSEGPPPASRWGERDPVAADRLARARSVVSAIAAEHGLPVENLLSPDLVRRLSWSPPEPSEAAVADALRAGGARAWQVRLTAGPLAQSLVQPVEESSARLA
jgi:ribonuclease D